MCILYIVNEHIENQESIPATCFHEIGIASLCLQFTCSSQEEPVHHWFVSTGVVLGHVLFTVPVFALLAGPCSREF